MERFQSRWYVCGFHDSISQSCWKMRFFAHPASGMHRRPENLPTPLQGTEPLSESAWHRSQSHRVGAGSNENANRLIRRWFPKGTDFSKVTAAQLAALQDWINNYPRKFSTGQSPIQFLASLLLQLSHFIFRWVSQSPLFFCNFEKENGSRVTLAWLSKTIRSSQITYCYTCRLLYAGSASQCRPTVLLCV